MRKIGTEEQIEKKKQRNILIISIFILVVLVFGTFGFGFISSPGFASNDNNDNNNELIPDSATSNGDSWLVRFEGQTFLLSNSPESVSEIPVEGALSLNDYVETVIYLDSEDEAMTREVFSVLGIYASRVQPFWYGACEADLPEKDCSENLVVIRNSEENKVYKDQNCVFIEGNIEAADAFIYHLLGM